MKYNYQNIAISKDFYKSGEGFSKCLERLDPSEQYRGTELAGYDAFQRQLKRFDIKVSGQDSDRLQKFFATSDSAALFPEYVARAVKQGVDGNHILEEICAARPRSKGWTTALLPPTRIGRARSHRWWRRADLSRKPLSDSRKA